MKPIRIVLAPTRSRPFNIFLGLVVLLSALLLLLALAVVCTAIGYSVWFIVIRECPVNVAALTIFVQSVFGVAIAALWLGEKLHWGQLLGSITIVAGLTLGLSRQIQRPAHRDNTLAERSG